MLKREEPDWKFTSPTTEQPAVLTDWQGRGVGNRERFLAELEGGGLAQPPGPSTEVRAIQQRDAVMTVSKEEYPSVNLIPAKQRQSSDPLPDH